MKPGWWAFTSIRCLSKASDEVLVNRYKETRRDHPLSGEGLTLHEAIREERNRLMPLRETANHLIDTSNLRPRALQKMLKEIVLNAGSEPPLRVEVLSFGFKARHSARGRSGL